MQSEPAAIIGTIMAIVSAVLVFLDEFGIDLTESQQDAINKLVAIAAPLLAGLIIRSFVVAPDTAQTKVSESYKSGQTGGPVPSVQV